MRRMTAVKPSLPDITGLLRTGVLRGITDSQVLWGGRMEKVPSTPMEPRPSPLYLPQPPLLFSRRPSVSFGGSGLGQAPKQIASPLRPGICTFRLTGTYYVKRQDLRIIAQPPLVQKCVIEDSDCSPGFMFHAAGRDGRLRLRANPIGRHADHCRRYPSGIVHNNTAQGGRCCRQADAQPVRRIRTRGWCWPNSCPRTHCNSHHIHPSDSDGACGHSDRPAGGAPSHGHTNSHFHPFGGPGVPLIQRAKRGS